MVNSKKKVMIILFIECGKKTFLKKLLFYYQMLLNSYDLLYLWLETKLGW